VLKEPKAARKLGVKRLQKREAKRLQKAARAALKRQAVKPVHQARQRPHAADAIPVADVARAAVNSLRARLHSMHLHIRSGSTGTDFFIRHLTSSPNFFKTPYPVLLPASTWATFSKAMLCCYSRFVPCVAHLRPGLLIFSHPANRYLSTVDYLARMSDDLNIADFLSAGGSQCYFAGCRLPRGADR
jgi:hypothetical protein